MLLTLMCYYILLMTEIPEHLLRRSQAARERAAAEFEAQRGFPQFEDIEPYDPFLRTQHPREYDLPDTYDAPETHEAIDEKSMPVMQVELIRGLFDPYETNDPERHTEREGKYHAMVTGLTNLMLSHSNTYSYLVTAMNGAAPDGTTVQQDVRSLSRSYFRRGTDEQDSRLHIASDTEVDSLDIARRTRVVLTVVESFDYLESLLLTSQSLTAIMPEEEDKLGSQARVDKQHKKDDRWLVVAPNADILNWHDEVKVGKTLDDFEDRREKLREKLLLKGLNLDEDIYVVRTIEDAELMLIKWANDGWEPIPHPKPKHSPEGRNEPPTPRFLEHLGNTGVGKDTAIDYVGPLIIQYADSDYPRNDPFMSRREARRIAEAERERQVREDLRLLFERTVHVTDEEDHRSKKHSRRYLSGGEEEEW